jgi:hypothetical protein
MRSIRTQLNSIAKAQYYMLQANLGESYTYTQLTSL